MPGYVYILTNRTMPGLVKIGSTKLTPNERARQLHTTGVASPYEVYASRRFYDHTRAERRIHAILAPYRENTQREFFRRSPEVAEKVLDQVLSEFGGPDAGTTVGIGHAVRTGLRVIVALGLGALLTSYFGDSFKSGSSSFKSGSSEVIPRITTTEVLDRNRTTAARDGGDGPPPAPESYIPLPIHPVAPVATDQNEEPQVVVDPPATATVPPTFGLEQPSPSGDSVSVPELAEWYSRDSSVADQRFRGKLIRLKGAVVKAEKQDIDFGLVHCQLNDALSVDLAAGQVVLVEGIVTGKRKKKKISVVGCDLLPQ
jgi:hypothetical protein